MLNYKQLDNVQKAINTLSVKGQKRVVDFLRYPTERNNCYLIGYLTSLYDNNLLPSWDYDILLALTDSVSPCYLLKEINWKV